METKNWTIKSKKIKQKCPIGHPVYLVKNKKTLRQYFCCDKCDRFFETGEILD